MTRIFLALVALACLSGCAAGASRSVILSQMDGTVQARLVENPNLIVVTMRVRGAELQYDLHKAKDRQAMVTAMLRDQCGNPEIVRTRATRTGTYAGAEQLTLTLDVSCPAGAWRATDGGDL